MAEHPYNLERSGGGARGLFRDARDAVMSYGCYLLRNVLPEALPKEESSSPPLAIARVASWTFTAIGKWRDMRHTENTEPRVIVLPVEDRHSLEPGTAEAAALVTWADFSAEPEAVEL